VVNDNANRSEQGTETCEAGPNWETNWETAFKPRPLLRSGTPAISY
jgi:hypothetical protein